MASRKRSFSGEMSLAVEEEAGVVVLSLFQCHAWSMKDDLEPVCKYDLGFDVEMALFKARSLWPSRRDRGRDNPYAAVANAVVEHLARCGVRCFRIAPGKAHGTLDRPYRQAEGGVECEKRDD